MLANFLVEDGPPGLELEAETAVDPDEAALASAQNQNFWHGHPCARIKKYLVSVPSLSARGRPTVVSSTLAAS